MSVPYEETARLEWTLKARDLVADGRIKGRYRITSGIASVHVWGMCPRCEDHLLDVRRTLTAVIPGDRSSPATPSAQSTAPVDVDCGCSHEHDGGPPGSRGCGVSFRIELPLESP